MRTESIFFINFYRTVFFPKFEAQRPTTYKANSGDHFWQFDKSNASQEGNHQPLKGRDILELYYIQISNKTGKKNVSQNPFTMAYSMHTEYESVNFVEGLKTNTRLLRTN